MKTILKEGTVVEVAQAQGVIADKGAIVQRDHGTYKPLLPNQKWYKSTAFYEILSLTFESKTRIQAKFVDIKFDYDLREDHAEIRCTREHAKVINETAPKAVLDMLDITPDFSEMPDEKLVSKPIPKEA